MFSNSTSGGIGLIQIIGILNNKKFNKQQRL